MIHTPITQFLSLTKDLQLIDILETKNSTTDIPDIPPWLLSAHSTNNHLCTHPESQTPNIIIKTNFYHKLASFKDQILCYTDESKQVSYTGYAFPVDKNRLNFKIPKYLSIFMAELMALLDYISYINTHYTEHNKNKYLTHLALSGLAKYF